MVTHDSKSDLPLRKKKFEKIFFNSFFNDYFCRECWTIMQQRQWQNDQHRKDFESGVRMGVGCFNLMISLLPARVMKLLEWIGFGGNKVGIYQII